MVINIIQDERGSFYLIVFTPLYGRYCCARGLARAFYLFLAWIAKNEVMAVPGKLAFYLFSRILGKKEVIPVLAGAIKAMGITSILGKSRKNR